MSKNRPFTVDHVGSFLRPQSIKEARKKVQEGLLSKEELRAIEDQEIKKLVEDQKAVGIKGITDGEFRRGFWHLDFLEELNGIEAMFQKLDIIKHSTEKQHQLIIFG